MCVCVCVPVEAGRPTELSGRPHGEELANDTARQAEEE